MLQVSQNYTILKQLHRYHSSSWKLQMFQFNNAQHLLAYQLIEHSDIEELVDNTNIRLFAIEPSLIILCFNFRYTNYFYKMCSL